MGLNTPPTAKGARTRGAPAYLDRRPNGANIFGGRSYREGATREDMC